MPFRNMEQPARVFEHPDRPNQQAGDTMPTAIATNITPTRRNVLQFSAAAIFAGLTTVLGVAAEPDAKLLDLVMTLNRQLGGYGGPGQCALLLSGRAPRSHLGRACLVLGLSPSGYGIGQSPRI